MTTNNGLFISGSSTEVGKTFVACRLIESLRKKCRVRVRKPVASGCYNSKIPDDAQLLMAAVDGEEGADVVCPFRFEGQISTEKASIDAGLDLQLSDLVDACKTPDSNDFMVVEGAGGLLSPIAKNALNSDLAAALKLPIVLVVKDELGAINQALLVIDAAKKRGLNIEVLVLNQITPNTLDNKKYLCQYTKTPIITLTYGSKILDFSHILPIFRR